MNDFSTSQSSAHFTVVPNGVVTLKPTETLFVTLYAIAAYSGVPKGFSVCKIVKFLDFGFYFPVIAPKPPTATLNLLGIKEIPAGLKSYTHASSSMRASVMF